MKEYRKQKSGGFTLMEKLIVVAIIAVLVAIAIPTFSGSLEKAKTSACLANRRNLYAAVTMQYMTENTVHDTELTAAEAKTYSCPAGGKITVRFDSLKKTFDINCSKHGLLFGKYSSPADALEDAINNITDQVIWNGNRTRIDSNCAADSAMTLEVLEQLKAMGVDIRALGANTWAVLNIKSGADKGVNFVWSSYDISKTDENKNLVKIYSSVPAIGMKPDGTYTVGMTSVKKSSSAGMGDYYTIAPSAETNGFNPSGPQSFSSLEEAKAYYETLKPTV